MTGKGLRRWEGWGGEGKRRSWVGKQLLNYQGSNSGVYIPSHVKNKPSTVDSGYTWGSMLHGKVLQHDPVLKRNGRRRENTEVRLYLLITRFLFEYNNYFSFGARKIPFLPHYSPSLLSGETVFSLYRSSFNFSRVVKKEEEEEEEEGGLN